MPKKYRPNVAAVIFNKEGDIWVGERADIRIRSEWQLPQGGININESPDIAIIREIYEETGIKSIKIINKINKWIYYDLPENIGKSNWSTKFVGQKQKWFLIYFFGTNIEIDINISNNPEFRSWKWDKEKNIINNVTQFRQSVYIQVFNEFTPIINDYINN